MASQAGPGSDDVGHGGESASLLAAGTFGTLLALAAVLVLYVLVAVWPPAPPAPVTTTTGPTTTTVAGQAAPTTTIAVQPAPNPPVQLFWWDLRLEREARLFLVVALAGALGGLVYALRSLAWYTGNRNLKYSWLLTYPSSRWWAPPWPRSPTWWRGAG